RQPSGQAPGRPCGRARGEARQADPHQGHRPRQREEAERPRYLAFRPGSLVEEGGGRMGRLLPCLPRPHRTRGVGETGEGAGEVEQRQDRGREMSTTAQIPLLSVRGVETYYGKI